MILEPIIDIAQITPELKISLWNELADAEIALDDYPPHSPEWEYREAFARVDNVLEYIRTVRRIELNPQGTKREKYASSR